MNTEKDFQHFQNLFFISSCIYSVGIIAVFDYIFLSHFKLETEAEVYKKIYMRYVFGLDVPISAS
jgi:hypothetical protein